MKDDVKARQLLNEPRTSAMVLGMLGAVFLMLAIGAAVSDLLPPNSPPAGVVPVRQSLADMSGPHPAPQIVPAATAPTAHTHDAYDGN